MVNTGGGSLSIPLEEQVSVEAAGWKMLLVGIEINEWEIIGAYIRCTSQNVTYFSNLMIKFVGMVIHESMIKPNHFYF